MLYLTIFIILIVLSFLEVVSKKSYKKFFIVIFSILSILTMTRYGVGTDYFSYNILYNTYSPIGINPIFVEHGEIGFRFLAKLFKTFSIEYIFFAMLFSFITCFILFKAILKQSNYYNFSLSILYTMFWFTYVNSGIRQGLAISISLFSLSYLKDRRFMKYFFLIILAALFHKSVLVMLFLPIIYFISINQMILLVIISFIIPIFNILNFDIFKNIFSLIGMGEYSQNTISINAIVLRLLVLFFIIFLYFMNKENSNNDFYLKISLIGYFVYFVFSGNDLIASRLHAYFKIVEIILIPNLICGIYLIKNRIIMFISYSMIFLPVFYYKEIDAQIEQGMYYDTRVFNYPYMSIFNDLENVQKVRFIENIRLIESK